MSGSLGARVTADVDAGSDTLVELAFDDGSRERFRPGPGLGAALTATLDLALGASRAVELELGAGLKHSAIAPADNASLSLWSFPLDLVLGYRAFGFRLAAGPAWSARTLLRGGGLTRGLSRTLPTRVGWTAGVDWVRGGVQLGVRYTDLGVSFLGEPYAARCLGLVLGFRRAVLPPRHRRAVE